jgi:hypothetical protein
MIGHLFRVDFKADRSPYFRKRFSCLENFSELRRGFPGEG